MLAFAAGAPAIYGQQFLFFRDPELLRRSRLLPAPATPNANAATAPLACECAPETPRHGEPDPAAKVGESEAAGSCDASEVSDRDFELDEEIMKYGLDDGGDDEGPIDG
jgi:hypothetical protein